MPQLGESIAEGTIVKWLIPPGGRVEKDHALLEVETDKVALEIPSPAAGFLTEVLIQEGQTVPVGTVLARLDTQQPATGVVNRVGGVVVRPMSPSGEGVDHYSPAVRLLAKEHGVDLAQVAGTGAGGRVTKKDVLDRLAKSGPFQKTTPAVQRSAEPAPAAAEQLVPLSASRKSIAERTAGSWPLTSHTVTSFSANHFASGSGR